MQLLFSVSGDAPPEYGLPIWKQSRNARVSEWLSFRARNSDVTSGIDSMSASASYVEDLDGNPLTENHHPLEFSFPEIDKLKIRHTSLSTDSVEKYLQHI